MAKLTDQLNDTTFTPTVTGGRAGGDLLGGLAEVGAGLFDAFESQNKRPSGPVNNVALDEAALGTFQIFTGIDLNAPGQKELDEAGKLKKARDNGAISGTAYDVRMQNWYADVLRRHPNQAQEVLAAGAERGYDDFYFREAKEQQQLAKNALDEDVKITNQALEYAAARGQYLPGQTPRELGILRGFELQKADAEQEMAKKTLEKTAQLANLREPIWQQKIIEQKEVIANNFIAQVHNTAQVGLEQYYNLLQAAGDDETRLKALEEVSDEGIASLMAMKGYARNEMYNNPSSITDKDTKETRVIPYSQDVMDRVDKEIQARIDEITKLRAMPGERQKRYLETMTMSGKMSAKEQMPTLMSMSESLDMKIPALIEALGTKPETLGLTNTQAASLLDEARRGMGAFSTKSFQFIQAATKAGQNPSMAMQGNDSIKAFQQNAMLSTMMGGLIRNQQWGEDGKEAILNNFEKSTTDIIMKVRGTYVPTNIKIGTAQSALKYIINNKMFDNIKAYEANGGDPALAREMGVQTAIAAGTFVEGLSQSSQGVKYNKYSGKYEAQSINAQQGLMDAAMFGPQYDPKSKMTLATDRDLAATLNATLDYIETVHGTYPIVDPTLMKEAGVFSIRDIASKEGGFRKYAQAVSKRAEQQLALKQKSDQLFDTAINEFNIDEDPFDNSPSRSSPAGQYNLTAKAPEEWEQPIASAAEEQGLDPALLTAMIKNESAFNPNAKGPSIAKFKGTKDEHAIGLGQLLPSTAEDLGVDVNDPNDNLRGAAMYLKQQMDAFNDDPTLALMAYNWGPSSVQNWLRNGSDVTKVPAQTLDYVKRILGVDLTQEGAL